MRLTKFRATPVRVKRFGTTRPSRLWASSDATQCTAKCRPVFRRPILNARSNAEAPHNRWCFEKRADRIAGSLIGSDSQASPAFGTASVDHRSASASFHADTKTMRTLATRHRRLISTLHDFSPKKSSIKPSFGKPCQREDTMAHSLWISDPPLWYTSRSSETLIATSPACRFLERERP